MFKRLIFRILGCDVVWSGRCVRTSAHSVLLESTGLYGVISHNPECKMNGSLVRINELQCYDTERTLRSVRSLAADVSGRSVWLMFKSRAAKKKGFTLENETDRLSRNVGS